jgi:hypothetical protein
MYPIGQPSAGPPPNHTSALGSTSLGLGGLGPMVPPSHPNSVGTHLTGEDSPPLGAPPGLAPVGSTTFLGSGSNGGTPTSILPPIGVGLGFGVATPPLSDSPTFVCPRRPNIGRDGRPILLRANHFQISMPRGYINHYQIRYVCM